MHSYFTEENKHQKKSAGKKLLEALNLSRYLGFLTKIGLATRRFVFRTVHIPTLNPMDVIHLKNPQNNLSSYHPINCNSMGRPTGRVTIGYRFGLLETKLLSIRA